MATFKERIAHLKESNARKLAEAQSEKNDSKSKKKRFKQCKPTDEASEFLPQTESNCQVIKLLYDVLDWKLRPKQLVKELPRGFLNNNYLVEVKGEGQLVVRHAQPEMHDLRDTWDLHQKKEFTFASAVGRNNLGPACTHYLELSDTIVSRHLEGWVPLDQKQAREHYRLILKMLTKLHGVPTQELLASESMVAEPFNVFEESEEFLRYCQSQTVVLPANVEDVFAALRRWKALLVSRPRPPECEYVVCHNDLRGDNIIALPSRRPDEDMQLRMIDFEWASLGDRYHDLATFSRLNGFADEDDVLLLKIYFGRFNDRQMVRLQLMKAVGDLYEAMRILAAVPFFRRHPHLADPSAEALPSDGPTTLPVFPSAADEKPPCPADVPSPPSSGGPLPPAMATRAADCYAAFEAKALSPEYFEYLANGL
jgi:thiamine kinase-like enzyme